MEVRRNNVDQIRHCMYTVSKLEKFSAGDEIAAITARERIRYRIGLIIEIIGEGVLSKIAPEYHGIGISTTIERIIACATLKRIIAIATGEAVGKCIANEGVVAGTTDQIFYIADGIFSNSANFSSRRTSLV